jgi:hypothetical protein
MFCGRNFQGVSVTIDLSPPLDDPTAAREVVKAERSDDEGWAWRSFASPAALDRLRLADYNVRVLNGCRSAPGPRKSRSIAPIVAIPDSW